MALNVRAVFKKQSAEQLILAAGAIVTGLTDNPAFPSPTVDLQTLQKAIDELNAAITAQAQGGRAATAEKNNKQAALLRLVRKLKHYVEDNCNDDLAVLLSSGFQAAETTRTRTPLANTAIVGLDFGTNRGEIVLKVKPVRRARVYEVRAAALGADNVPGPWQAAGLFMDSRSITIAGLTPGTTYAFQVRAVGGSTGYSDWSNPVSRMAA
jgi:hypothetical protein